MLEGVHRADDLLAWHKRAADDVIVMVHSGHEQEAQPSEGGIRENYGYGCKSLHVQEIIAKLDIAVSEDLNIVDFPRALP